MEYLVALVVGVALIEGGFYALESIYRKYR